MNVYEQMETTTRGSLDVLFDDACGRNWMHPNFIDERDAVLESNARERTETAAVKQL
jgi:hypothetical protein